MRSKYTVLLRTIAEEHGLQVLHASRDYETKKIVTYDVNRPAMQLAGFYNYFDPARIQIIGRVESTYLDTLSDAERLAAFERFMQFDIAALVICHGVQPFPECMEMAEKYDRTVFITPEDTSEFQAGVISSLRRHLAPRTTVHGVLVEIYGEGVLLTGDSGIGNHLAPRTTVHGVLVEIYGEGVLLTGDSGIGKSETALELIKRGHRLIADDAVEIKKIGRDSLVGDAPEMIRYYMELRGIGVVNVRRIYGIGAVKPESGIDLVVHLEPWEEGKAYDRLGLTSESEVILGVEIPRVTIPVRPGRNLAVILELAAMNNRQKKLGYNAAEALAASHDALIDGMM